MHTQKMLHDLSESLFWFWTILRPYRFCNLLLLIFLKFVFFFSIIASQVFLQINLTFNFIIQAFLMTVQLWTDFLNFSIPYFATSYTKLARSICLTIFLKVFAFLELNYLKSYQNSFNKYFQLQTILLDSNFNWLLFFRYSYVKMKIFNVNLK